MKRAILLLSVLGFSALVSAQELEPRAYSASPVGLNFAILGIARSRGDVLFDPTIHITDANAVLTAGVAGYGRTFSLFGRQALAVLAVPYVRGEITGSIGDRRGRVDRSGLADLKAKLSVNLLGNPAMSPAEFARTRPGGLMVGASLSVTAPTGQYSGKKLINLGTNRWGFKPEVGVSFPWKKFDFDAYFGVWFFTENSDFYTGGRRKQEDPLTAAQAHISYTFRPGLWIAADGTWYGGGASHINGGPALARIDSSRIGATASIPLSKSQSVKLSYSDGVSARAGANFQSLGLSWQYRWF